jgi:gluconolactonase
MSALHVREVADGLFFPEGPVALPSGDVIVCELATGHLVRIASDGTKTVIADVGMGCNGLAMGPDGRIWVAHNGGNQWRWSEDKPHPTGLAPDDWEGGYIKAVDTVTGVVEVIATHADGRRFSGLNDLVFDAEGNLYFTDSGKHMGIHRIIGGLYYLPRGASEAAALAYPLEQPNGVGLSPDGSRLYVSETSTAQVWYWDIESPGVLRPGHTPYHPGGGTLLSVIPGYCMLDSLAVDLLGHVCVATLLRGGLNVIKPDGGLEATLHIPDRYVTNICFGGEDLSTAYVTAAEHGKLWAIDWPWPGLKLNFFDGSTPPSPG